MNNYIDDPILKFLKSLEFINSDSNIKFNYKIYVKDKSIYLYDDAIKLWQEIEINELNNMIIDFFNLNNVTCQDTALVLEEILTVIEIKIKTLNFCMNKKQNMIPIRDGKIIDCENKIIRTRTSDDLFSFELNVFYDEGFNLSETETFFENYNIEHYNTKSSILTTFYKLFTNTCEKKIINFIGEKGTGKKDLLHIFSSFYSPDEISSNFKHVDSKIQFFCLKNKNHEQAGIMKQLVSYDYLISWNEFENKMFKRDFNILYSSNDSPSDPGLQSRIKTIALKKELQKNVEQKLNTKVFINNNINEIFTYIIKYNLGEIKTYEIHNIDKSEESVDEILIKI